MLANNEPIQGLDLSQTFRTMLNELPWGNLRSYIQSNSQLLKVCTAGGHRLAPKSRSVIEKRIVKEAEKNEFDATFCSALFAFWYPVHEDLHKKLEDYFHSDEYKQYREEHDIAEDEYRLSDEKFDEFFDINQLEQWRVLLAFSPLQFSEEQSAKIVTDSEGNTELLQRMKKLEVELAKLSQDKKQLQNENAQLRNQYSETSNEAQELRRSQRELKNELDESVNKLQRSLADSRRFQDLVQAAEKKIKTYETSMTEKLEQASIRLRNDLNRVQNELSIWQAKYEEQRLENKRLEEEIAQTRRTGNEKQKHAEAVQAENDHLNSFANLLLKHFDWPKIGRQLKLTPTLKRQFNSLVKKLDYDESRNLTIEDTLEVFWTNLIAQEKELIDNIAQSNTREVIRGDAENYWLTLSDVFEDVRIGLEARTILLKMIEDIFYQAIEDEDLDVSHIWHISGSKSKKKK